MRQTLLLEVRYLGDYFYGVQPQGSLRTVGLELRERLERALGARANGLTFAARTDSGVSARQNFVTTWFRDVDDLPKRLLELERRTAEPLQLLNVWPVPRSMHARNCALGKHYRYRISQDPSQPRAWCAPVDLNAAAMQRAASLLVGRHDFSAFRSSQCGAKNPLKRLTQLTVAQRGPDTFIDVEGDGFLRHMVRILVGTLAEVGAGLRPWQDVASVLASRRRSSAGLTAPAEGLSLQRVDLRWPGQRHAGWPLVLHEPSR
jgi:tRNA pseudouridine38-40 synthase